MLRSIQPRGAPAEHEAVEQVLGEQLRTCRIRFGDDLLLSQLGDEDSDEEDPFAEVEEDDFDEADLETNVARDKLARLASYVSELVDSIASDTDEYSLREASLELVRLILLGRVQR